MAINDLKELSNSFSTGSGGARFEANIQAAFVTLMLSGGYAPCLPAWPIVEIKLQGMVAGYATDDLIVFVENPASKQKCKLLGQVKHSISVTEGSKVFGEVLQAAWADFNNATIFTKGMDIIALITGPISATDSDGVSGLLEQARHCKDASEFLRQVGRAKFCSDTVRAKLNAFKSHLKKANNDLDVAEDDLFEFLRHFHLLGYDLSRKGSIVSSLLQSHIAQFNKEIPDKIWYHIIHEVQSFNKEAGTITLDSIDKEIIDYFSEPKLTYIPSRLSNSGVIVESHVEIAPTDWLNHKAANKIALAHLLGGWDEGCDSDISIVSKVADEAYVEWVGDLRDALQLLDCPLSYRDGVWCFNNRVDSWDAFGSRVFDNHLDCISEVCLEVLGLDDPIFELPENERYAAAIHGKLLSHSKVLREGLAGTLALLGTRYNALDKCRNGKPEAVVNSTIAKLLMNANWVRWGSLNELLPTLSEASPDHFLSAVERAVLLNPSPYLNLFAQEGEGVFGRNYMVGVLWALELLAWHDEHLVRSTVALADIAALDPGGNWANRARNSLVDIFLPWLPHTLGSIKKRQAALRSIVAEQPQVGWRLLINLLPNEQRSTSGTFKPVWRKNILNDWSGEVSNQEFWEQSRFCAELLVCEAGSNTERLTKLVSKYSSLPPEAAEALLTRLSSDDVCGAPEEQRFEIWDSITRFVIHHKSFPDAEWSLKAESLAPLLSIAESLEPKNPMLRYKQLFSGRDYYRYYNSSESYEKSQERLSTDRRYAIEQILAVGGFDGVIEFASIVADSQYAGDALADLDGLSFDISVLPYLIESESSNIKKFVAGYAWRKRWKYGWEWFDNIDFSGWSPEQIASLLCMLPFDEEAWDRVEKKLGDNSGQYWKSTPANMYQAGEKTDFAVRKLLEYGRSDAALEAFIRDVYGKNELDPNLACDTLLLFGGNGSESKRVDGFQIVEIIKSLQNNPSVDQEKLFRVEWMYLTLLDHSNNASPITLERKLASDPEFFCTLIKAIYAPKDGQVDEDPTVDDRNIATNAYRLLSDWRLVPGTTVDNQFDATAFVEWLKKVDVLTQETGHFDVAMSSFGSVLIHAPSEKDFWINHTVAKTLNERERESLRDGYAIATFNSRGVHWVDPEAKPERELAEKYRQKAEQAELSGYHRFATTLRGVAADYDRHAERILARQLNT
ncbi:hypothetical protein [Pseudomonas mohnii]